MNKESFKLKPCPFCNTQVLINKKPLWHGNHGYIGCFEYDIQCEKCGCNIKLPNNNTIYTSDSKAIENAVNAWNRRAYE